MVGWVERGERTGRGWRGEHFQGCLPPGPGTSCPYSLQMFLYTMPATWLCHSKYALLANILNPGVLSGMVDPGLYCSGVQGLFIAIMHYLALYTSPNDEN
ncbi:hypothetical protein D4764_01G0016420 [Takifugu flavidus]|uniref:Uncharacterized protein n=1 Tax=Takifugu flavidus TaxID=433684 RepID=A0A5C6PTN6_9TELE|nr:hypothetical protein D4764_01G0016420 [Takifugu flavidus]